MLHGLQRLALPALLAGAVVFAPGLQAQEPSVEPEAAEAGEKEEKAPGRERPVMEGEKLTVGEALKRLGRKLPESIDLEKLRVVVEDPLKPCSISLLPLRPTAKGTVRSVEPPPGPHKMREVDPPAPSCDDL